MKVFNGHVVHSQGSALAVWRSAIAYSARKAGAFPKKDAITITMAFIMQKPKTVKRDYPTVPPDLDKLIRSVLDALTAVAYVDDSQVCEIYATKGYGLVPGVRIQIAEKV